MAKAKVTIHIPNALGGGKIEADQEVYQQLINSAQLRDHGRLLLGWQMGDGLLEYKAVGNFIPVEEWGDDHWERFTYFRHVINDFSGWLPNDKMRCDARLHPHFANTLSMLTRPTDAHGHPTKLKDRLQHNHDDWSIVEDMVAAGLLQCVYRYDRAKMLGSGQAHIRLLPWGIDVMYQLHDYFSIHLTRKGFMPTKEGNDEQA